MRSTLLALLVPLALAGETTPAGPVGQPVDMRSVLPENVLAALPVEPVTHKKRVPIGKDSSGEVEITWGTAEAAGGAWVTDVSVAVTRPSEGIEVLAPVVLPPINRGTEEAPVAGVGIVLGWRKDSACRSEMASTTFEVDGKGDWKAL